MATVILTGGGTAGHCVPNIALIPYLKKNFDSIVYIGSKNGIEKKLVKDQNIPYYEIETVKLIRSFTLKNLTIPFKLLKGIRESKKIIEKIKPDVIFSKGGYVALPVVMSAKNKKIPVISHESDFSLGLANKISARYSKSVLTSFPETAEKIKNGLFVGTPIRHELFSVDKNTALKKFGFSGAKPILLITGGSLGAKAINGAVRSALDELLKIFDVLHICGKGNVNGSIKKDGYVQTEFADMKYAYAAADVCVSRAGSNTVFELLSLEIPSLLIPLPKTASRGDQILNAEYFKKKGAFDVLYQEQLSTNKLSDRINKLYLNRSAYKEKLKKLSFRDASRDISRLIYECANNRLP